MNLETSVEHASPTGRSGLARDNPLGESTDLPAVIPSLGNFILRIIFWLPLCFAVWYFSAREYASVVGGGARWMIEQFKPGILVPLESLPAQAQQGFDLSFMTSILIPASTGRVGGLLLGVSPLIYTCGLAFFLALMLAARARWWKILLGVAILLPFQSWGIAFDVLVQIAVKLGPEVSWRAGFTAWQREFVALGYQLGFLIFPSLVPVILWAVLNRPFIESLLRHRDPRKPATFDSAQTSV